MWSKWVVSSRAGRGGAWDKTGRGRNGAEPVSALMGGAYDGVGGAYRGRGPGRDGEETWVGV